MYLLLLGIAMMLLKYLQVGVVANWSWWWVLSPFAMAVVWWSWADASGYTKRKEMEKAEQKKRARIARLREDMRAPSKRR
jgi:small Trp-rich protein